MLTVIKPALGFGGDLKRFDKILTEALAGEEVRLIENAQQFREADLTNQKILFAIGLDEKGLNYEYYKVLWEIRDNPKAFKGSVGAIIVDGTSELFTKSTAKQLAFSANAAGCTFVGRSLVEATGSLKNFDVMKKLLGLTAEETYIHQTRELAMRLRNYDENRANCRKKHAGSKEKLLVIHASNRTTSNSLLLWEKVKSHLNDTLEIEEISIRNGTIADCRGCSYEACVHFGEKGDCFYGGIMVEQVYPALIECDKLLLICPNYNDALSANITAFINRLTACVRTNDLSEKQVYAIVISGYSGGDIISEQIIGAMNFNKGLIVPGNFAMVETANDPKTILLVEDIDEKAKMFADGILREV